MKTTTNNRSNTHHDNNLQNTPKNKVIIRLEKLLVTIAIEVSQGLFHENNEIVLETARVLGNLTRRSQVIQLLYQKRIDRALWLLLSHINIEVISSVAGIFVNISACSEGRQLLLGKEAFMTIQQLSGILRKLTLKDTNIAILITQVK
jgi:hypothetical protein